MLSPNSQEIQELFAQAKQEDLLVKMGDGSEFLLSAVNDFDQEIVAARRNAKLMAFLEQRARQTQTVSLDEVERQLGLDD